MSFTREEQEEIGLTIDRYLAGISAQHKTHILLTKAQLEAKTSEGQLEIAAKLKGNLLTIVTKCDQTIRYFENHEAYFIGLKDFQRLKAKIKLVKSLKQSFADFFLNSQSATKLNELVNQINPIHSQAAETLDDINYQKKEFSGITTYEQYVQKLYLAYDTIYLPAKNVMKQIEKIHTNENISKGLSLFSSNTNVQGTAERLKFFYKEAKQIAKEYKTQYKKIKAQQKMEAQATEETSIAFNSCAK